MFSLVCSDNNNQPKQSFDVLVADMDRHYSFFDAHGIEWQALTRRYRARAQAADTPQAFIEVIRPMLAELKDLHVSIVDPDGKRIPTVTTMPKLNIHLPTILAGLETWRQIGRVGIVGRTKKGGFAYVAVGSLEGHPSVFSELVARTAELLDAPGLIMDLRGNMGGSEVQAQRIAALFIDRERTYARSEMRAGPHPGDLVEVRPRSLDPGTVEKPYGRPIVCLLGPGCVSSGEGMAMMMRVVPKATLLGQPTRGASGNPAPAGLPNGVTVWYSRWISMLPDGTPIERKGVQPDKLIEHRGTGDVTFDAAIEELQRQTK